MARKCRWLAGGVVLARKLEFKSPRKRAFFKHQDIAARLKVRSELAAGSGACRHGEGNALALRLGLKSDSLKQFWRQAGSPPPIHGVQAVKVHG